ncbi:MAG: hypothetical protein WAP03_25765 [Methylorubrum rhodinum]
MRHRRQHAGIGGERTVGLGQKFPERTQHQRERGAELVADVGEERRLGLVELRQRLGPPAFLLQDAGVRDGRRDMSGHEVEKTAVARVDDPPRTDPDDEEARRPLVVGVLQRQDERRFDRVGPEVRRDLAAAARKIGHFRRSSRLGDEAERPGAIRRNHIADRVDRRKCRALAEPSCAGDPACSNSLFVREIEGRERDIEGIAVQNLGRLAASDLDGPMLGTPRAQVTQGRKPPLSNDFLGRFVASAEDALDPTAVFIEDRAVSKGDVDLLVRHRSGEEHLVMFDPRCPTGPHLVVHRSNRRPDLAPGDSTRFTEHGRMLGSP